jgi:hypothetical protein
MKELVKRVVVVVDHSNEIVIRLERRLREGRGEQVGVS